MIRERIFGAPIGHLQFDAGGVPTPAVTINKQVFANVCKREIVAKLK